MGNHPNIFDQKWFQSYIACLRFAEDDKHTLDTWTRAIIGTLG